MRRTRCLITATTLGHSGRPFRASVSPPPTPLLDPRRHGAPLVPLAGDSSQIVSRIGTPVVDTLALPSVAFVSTALWANPLNSHVWIAIGAAAAYGLIGFHDDYFKMMQRGRNQFSQRTRLLIETIIAIAAWIAILRTGPMSFTTSLLFGWPSVISSFLSLGLSIVLVVGAANAAKLIDSGNRSAIVRVTIVAAVLGMIAYLSANVVFARHLQVQYVAGVGELAVLCAAVVGVCLGLVWCKAVSSPVIGDAGSLALGAALGTTAVIIL